jgi:protein ImuB
MLWLCILLPRFALEASAGAARGPEHGHRPPPAAQAALQTLALWALQWSGQVSPHAAEDGSAILWLEIGASRRLFGDHASLRDRVATGLIPLGYTHRLGIAPTPQGAALLARAGLSSSALTHAQLLQLLESLPLALLALPDAQLMALHGAGLRHIGEVLRLPSASIAQRFGADANLYLQRLRGAVHEPLRYVQAPGRFYSRCEFQDPVTDTTALLFPLQRLLAGLQGYLRARERAVQRYTLRLEHHRGAVTCLAVSLTRPSRDAAQLLLLARERLAATTLAAPVHGLGVAAHELLQPLLIQSDLFSRDAQQNEQFQQVLDRLAARLGANAVQALSSADEHRPERAWRMRAAQLGAPMTAAARTANAQRDAADIPGRPCWLLPEPRRIDRPQELLAGPERIESGWWDGADMARDYYLAREANGAQLWVFQDLRGGSWHVHGIWA